VANRKKVSTKKDKLVKQTSTSFDSLSSEPSTSLAADTLINKLEQLDIEQIFAQSLSRYKREQLLDSKQKAKEINHLYNIIEEYLSCFVIIGFSLQNEKVCIFNAQNSKDEGALVDLLRSTFIEIISNRP
jgi:hypothetical protein